MKKVLVVMLVMSWSCFGATKEVTIQFPKNPIIGILGASVATCQAPKDSPLGGVGLAGCSYEGIYEALIKDSKISAKGYRVENVAYGGGYSYDVPQTGWQGLLSQYADLTVRTSWVDGIKRLKAIVLSPVNDCFHTAPCSQADITNVLIKNTQDVISLAQSQGVKVYVVGYPEWNQLNLALAAQIYGLSNVINEQDYNYLKTTYKNQIAGMPGVVYLDSWKNNFSSFDGLHPNQKNVRKVAKELGKMITK